MAFTMYTTSYEGRRLKFSADLIEQKVNSSGIPYSRISWTLTGDDDPSYQGSIPTYYMAGGFKVAAWPWYDQFETQYLYTSSSTDRIQLKNGTVVASGEAEFLHQEGTGELTIQFEVSGAIYSYNTNVSGKSAYKLPTYEWVNPGLEVLSSYTIGGTRQRIRITNWNKDCTYTISFRGVSIPKTTIVEKTKESYIYWAPPGEICYQYMPNISQAAIYFSIVAYDSSGSTVYTGTDITQSLAVVSEEYNKPIVDSIDITLNSSDTITETLTGSASKFIRNVSKVDYTVTSHARNYATITATNITNAGQIQYGPTGTFPNPITTASFVATVTDSRGFKGANSKVVDLVNYVPLTCSVKATPLYSSSIEGAYKTDVTVEGYYWDGDFGVKSNSIKSFYYEWWEDNTITQRRDLNPPTLDPATNTYTFTFTPEDLIFPNLYTYAITIVIEDEISVQSFKVELDILPIYDWGPDDFKINVPTTIGADTTINGNLNITGQLQMNGYEKIFPTVSTWSPIVYNSDGSSTTNISSSGTGMMLKIGDCIILNWYVEGTYKGTTSLNKICIRGFMWPPDGTRWWAGGGNAAGYYLSTDGTAFNGWCLEAVKTSGTSVTYGICGRAGAIRSGETTATSKSSSYIGLAPNSTFYFSGTLMYKMS